MKNASEFLCQNPFEVMEIHPEGTVYICCPNWNNYYSIGNIFENTFEEVWNSEKAKELRRRVLNGDYSLCDISSCPYLKQKNLPLPRRAENRKNFLWWKEDISPSVHMKKGPVLIKLSYDPECNIACKMCRDKIIRLSDEELELYNSRIESFFIPLLKDVRILQINAHGDAFGSRHSRLLIEKVAKKYKHIKFDFQTNGILCTQKMLKHLNISADRIHTIRISIHAASADTYSKIVPNGENLFPVILKNLQYLSQESKKQKFRLFVHFVVSALNYKEIPSFIKLAEIYDVKPFFWELRLIQYNYNPTDDDFIVEKNHPLHEDLKRVLRHPICKKYKDNFTPQLVELMND